MFVGERGGRNIWLNCRFLRKGNVQNIPGVVLLPRPRQPYLEQTKLVCQRLAFLGFFPIPKNIFPIIDQCRFFFTSGSTDILMNVSEDCMIFLIWAVWASCFVFNKNEDFQSGALVKMIPRRNWLLEQIEAAYFTGCSLQLQSNYK